ncbi:MAG: SOS response-associated peptidase family protein [Rhodoplanes sp.]
MQSRRKLRDRSRACRGWRLHRTLRTKAAAASAFGVWRRDPSSTKLTDREPYAIALKDRSPFGIAGIWENWKNPHGEWVRTFAILTTPANELVGTIHDRMPAVLAPAAYDRWLGNEPDPRDLLQPFPSELMTIWPISTRVNSPSNDDEHLLDEIELTRASAAVIGPESSADCPLPAQRTAKTATRQ